ncbi:hypothetical protein FQZ97_803320 [compost metagenome]
MRREPREQGDVQARDRHQVGDAGGTEHVPVGTVDGALVAGDERGDHAGLAPVVHAREDRIAHGLARPLDRVPPRRAQQARRGVARPGPHMALGMHALLPRPQLAVEAMRIEVAVRRAQAHGQLPALAGMHLAHGACDGCATFGGLLPHPAVVAVPGERDARRHRRRCFIGSLGPPRRLHIETEARSDLAGLRHLRDHAREPQVAPFE